MRLHLIFATVAALGFAMPAQALEKGGQVWQSLNDFTLHGGDCEEYAGFKAMMLNKLNPAYEAAAMFVRIKNTNKPHAITMFKDIGNGGLLSYMDNRAPYGGPLRDAATRYELGLVFWVPTTDGTPHLTGTTAKPTLK